MSFEYSLSGKWLGLLKQIAPTVTRVAVLRGASQGSGTSEFAAIATAAPALKVDVNPVNMRDAEEIERAVAVFARSPNRQMIPTGSFAAYLYRNLIVTLAAQHKPPAVYTERRSFVAAGGIRLLRPWFLPINIGARLAMWTRILKGEKPADLPVQRRQS